MTWEGAAMDESVALSRACFEGAHDACGMETCECEDCHRQRCERCLSRTTSRYNISNTVGMPRLVCPECVGELGEEAMSPLCDQCGAPGAYRDPPSSTMYLCMGCHGQHMQEMLPLMHSRERNE
mgnify:CR=1 FL=1